MTRHVNLRGVWPIGSRMGVRQIDNHFDEAGGEALGVTGGSVVAQGGVLTLANPLPGVASLYYAVCGGNVLWDEYPWDLRVRIAATKHSGAPVQVKAGEAVTIKGSGAPVVSKLPDYAYQRVTDKEADGHPFDLAGSVTPFLDLLVERIAAAHRSLPAGSQVLAFASGGTDSTLTCWALKEAGIPFKAISIGRSLDDFDPKYAVKYAEELGTDFEFVPLPSPDDRETWTRLVDTTVDLIQMVDMSNTMMAICERWGMEAFPGRVPFYGYFADTMVGGETRTVYSFRKHEDQGRVAWMDHLYADGMYISYPNTLHIARVSKQRGTNSWRSPFLDHAMFRFISKCSRDCFSATDRMTKPLLEAACASFLKTRSWEDKRKIGFYSGAGVSGLRNDGFEFVQDAYFQAAGHRARKRLGL